MRKYDTVSSVLLNNTSSVPPHFRYKLIKTESFNLQDGDTTVSLVVLTTHLTRKNYLLQASMQHAWGVRGVQDYAGRLTSSTHCACSVHQQSSLEVVLCSERNNKRKIRAKEDRIMSHTILFIFASLSLVLLNHFGSVSIQIPTNPTDWHDARHGEHIDEMHR